MHYGKITPIILGFVGLLVVTGSKLACSSPSSCKTWSPDKQYVTDVLMGIRALWIDPVIVDFKVKFIYLPIIILSTTYLKIHFPESHLVVVQMWTWGVLEPHCLYFWFSTIHEFNNKIIFGWESQGSVFESYSTLVKCTVWPCHVLTVSVSCMVIL